MVTFLGFPLGGFAVYLLLGPVDSPGAALVGGLIAGAVLGAGQAWGLRRGRRAAASWTAATAVGLMAGLGIGATVVGFETSMTALVVQGAISGCAVGAAQALELRARLGAAVLAWPALLAAVWAAGWATTVAAGIQVEERFTTFGASGALVVTALTAVLPLLLDRTRTARS
jgi:hypothetical protein